ncbi:MAG: TIGR01906 family membrane protein [Anaerolineaceae bacterium]
MKTIYKVIMILAFFLVILVGGIRLCLTHFFIDIEYTSPGFPMDAYGFSKDIRSEFAYQSVDYLIGKLTDAEFQAIAFPDGKLLFNEREFSHMQDVRDLTMVVLRVWYISLGTMLVGIFLAIKLSWRKELDQAGKLAGMLIFLFILLVLLGVFLDFDQLFTAFHSIFFEGDTWLFYTNDSLLRLFPTPFWVNVFITVGVISATFAFILFFSCGWLLKKNKEEV